MVSHRNSNGEHNFRNKNVKYDNYVGLYYMCWNAEVSLNTFLFSIFVLGLVYYNNHYTKYKIKEFNNEWLYIFLLLSFSMQLIEFFIWRNLENKYYNKIFTICAFILIFCQPIASLMLLNDQIVRNILVFIYILLGIPYVIYYIMHKEKIASTVASSGNLKWNFNINKLVLWMWVSFLLFSFLYQQKWLYFSFAVTTFLLFIYKESSTSGSVWCWFINSISIYLAVYLLFYLPYYENKEIC